ncbi:MAG: leucine-rich repeat protein [Prevotella sp.]|nr:leucine-rich repeat protein [Prevotella sp.]
MKQYYTLFLIALLSMATGKVSAYDAKIDGIFYNLSGGEAQVTREKAPGTYTGRVVIPELVTYEGKEYKVTSIGEGAFYACSNDFASVVIPNTITSIGDHAFYRCEGLTSINVPNSVTVMGRGAFLDCSKLTTISLSNSLETIGEQCFESCGKLSSVTMPNTVKSLGKNAFYRCYELTSVVMSNSISAIRSGTFRECSKLASINIPSSVTEIEETAFYQCNNLSEVYISDLEAWLRIPFVDQKATNDQRGYSNPLQFAKHLYLNGEEVKDLVIPTSITKVPQYSFYGFKGLRTITLHNAVTSIEEGAFRGCGTIESVNISNSVTSIGNNAFYQDTIHSLTIGSGVLEIGQSAFGGHDSSYEERSFIKKTIWLTNTPPTNYTNAAGNVNYVSNNLFTFDKDRYRITNLRIYIYPLLSSAFAIDGVKYVPTSMADRTCDAFDAVYDESAALTKLGTTVTYRGVTFKVNNVNPYTCCGNTFVKKAELGEGLPYIADHVFDGCRNLESAKLPETITWLGISSFQDCTSLKEIALPAATTNVLFNAFKGCLSLKNVTMNDGAGQLSLDYNALISVNYETNKVTVYSGTPLFEDCPLDKVYIGRNIAYGTSKNEGYSPFYRNTSLREVEITDRETEIGENEFYGCSGLKSVKIGDGVTTFGNWAFSGCSSLDYFEFGSSVKTIGKEAFSDCSAVKNVISHTAVPPVCGSQAMDDINKWDCTLTVPNGSTAAYQAADQWKEFLFTQDYDAYKAGVSDITADVDKAAPVYSLSGLRLAAPRKGINIIGGKKVAMK